MRRLMTNHHERERRGPPTEVICATLILLGLSAGLFVYRYAVRHDHPLFWDLKVYTGSIRAHALGLSPYDPQVWDHLHVDSLLKYTSTPLVDRFFHWVAHVPILAVCFEPLSLLLHTVAVVSIIAMLSALFLGRTLIDAAFGCGIFLLMFSTAGLSAFAAANNGTLLYAAIIAAAMLGFRKGRWSVFHVAVATASAVKPIYASWWILPILANGFAPLQLGVGVASGCIALLTYLAFLVFDPSIFHAWIDGLRSQADQTINDLGENVFGAVMRLPIGRAHLWIPLAAQTAYNFLLLTILLGGRFIGPLRWAALIVIAVYVNPRPMGYDVAIASIPLLALAASTLTVFPESSDRLLVAAGALVSATLVLPYERFGLVPMSVLHPWLAFVVLAFAAVASRRRIGAADRLAVTATGLHSPFRTVTSDQPIRP